MSVNKAILVGRLGKDVETKFMTTGDAVANASLATSEQWKDKNGEKQEKTEWHNLVFYRRLAEIAGEYLRKGALIYVEGRIQTRKYQDKEGHDRYITEIVVNEMRMLGSKSDNQTESRPAPAPSDSSSMPQQTGPQPGNPFANFDDDVPF